MTDLEEQIEGFRGLLARAITKKNSLFQLSSMDEQEDQKKIEAAKKEVQQLKNVLEEAINDYKEYQLLAKSVEGVRVTKDPTPVQGSDHSVPVNSTVSASNFLTEASALDAVNVSPNLLRANLSQLPNDLPQFILGKTEIQTFLKLTEATLTFHGTPVRMWPRALGKQAKSDVVKLWVHDHVVEPGLSWQEAREAFITEFSTHGDSVEKVQDELLDLVQGTTPAETFFRNVETLAAISKQDLNASYFKRTLLKNKIHASLHCSLAQHFGASLDQKSFQDIKLAAIYLDQFRDLPSSKQPHSASKKDKKRNQTQAPTPGKIYVCFGCGGTGHKRRDCFAYTEQCRKCGRVGHLDKMCTASSQRDSKSSSSSSSSSNSRNNAPSVTCH